MGYLDNVQWHVLYELLQHISKHLKNQKATSAVTVKGWYLTKRPMYCGHFLINCATPSEL
jgi:hypothetical protein